jgi:hypothetical protein
MLLLYQKIITVHRRERRGRPRNEFHPDAHHFRVLCDEAEILLSEFLCDLCDLGG